jgi:hypothetical protein
VSIVGELINLFEDWKNIDPSREDIPAHADYLYHATNTYNVHDIVNAKKLHTHRPGYGTDQEEWPDGRLTTTELDALLGPAPIR